MQIFRGFHHPGIARACALTIGNFDGVHRGHQAMLALLNNEARHRGVPSCVMTFEPHPRDYFAGVLNKPELAPARIATLRDKLTELAACGVDQCVVLPFDARLSGLSPQAFIDDVLVRGLGVRYVLVLEPTSPLTGGPAGFTKSATEVSALSSRDTSCSSIGAAALPSRYFQVAPLFTSVTGVGTGVVNVSAAGSCVPPHWRGSGPLTV